MKMIIDWDTVVAMSEEIYSGNSLRTKRKMVDLDVLYSICERFNCGECFYRHAWLNSICIKNGLHTCPVPKIEIVEKE